MNAPTGYIEKHIQAVRELLLNRADLTHRTLIESGHGWRLAAVIHELRKREWPIETTKDGRGIAHYRLSPGWYPDAENPLKPGSEKGVPNEG